jgi:signal transduction histidine kinase
MAVTASWWIDRVGRSRLLLVAWAASAVVNLVLMYYLPGGETIPFHLVWIGLSIVYGFTDLRPLGMTVILVSVAVTTGYVLLHHARLGAIGWEEATEVPLMSAVFGVMVWHVHRRQRALAQVARMVELERQRATVQQLLVRFASHELRTPITIARGYTELLRDAMTDPAARQDADTVLNELDRVARITYRLVTLIQLDGPTGQVATDVDRELTRVVHRWEPVADRAWEVRSTVGELIVNPDRLEAALDCLLENAIKFTVDGDRIAVVGAGAEDGWTIEVVDSGVGLAEGQAETLMAASVPLPTTSGTGLGLGVVRAVVESFGGRVAIAGRPGEGTTVTLSFPPAPRPLAGQPAVVPTPA